LRSPQITTSDPGVLPMATAVWVPSHRAPELTKPLSSTAKGSGVATGGGGGRAAGGGALGDRFGVTAVDGRALGCETGWWVAHFTIAPTKTTSTARRTAEPPKVRRLRTRSRRGGGCFRCRPRDREGCVRYPELITKVAPVMQLRALVVGTFCTRCPCENPGRAAARFGPNHVDSLRDLLATRRRRWRCDYGG
jgi:hypothetical protein